MDQLSGLRGAVDSGVQFLADRLMVLHRELMEIYSLTSSIREERPTFQAPFQAPFQPFQAPPCPPPPCSRPPSPCQNCPMEPLAQPAQAFAPYQEDEEPMSRADSHGSQGALSLQHFGQSPDPFGQNVEPAKQARHLGLMNLGLGASSGCSGGQGGHGIGSPDARGPLFMAFSAGFAADSSCF